MRVRVLVEVIDDDGRRLRKQSSTEVPPAVVKTHRVVSESHDDLLRFVLNDVVSSALGAVSRPQAPQQALEEAIKTGGSRASRGAPGKANKLDEMLGLDIIEHMDGMEQRQGGGQRPKTPADLARPQTGIRR